MEDVGGPPGCLQYFMGNTGVIASFNYPIGSTTVSEATDGTAGNFSIMTLHYAPEIFKMGNSNSPKMLILTILEVLNFDLVNLSNFQKLSLPKFKVQSSKIAEMAFLDYLNLAKLYSK